MNQNAFIAGGESPSRELMTQLGIPSYHAWGLPIENGPEPVGWIMAQAAVNYIAPSGTGPCTHMVTGLDRGIPHESS